MQDWYVFALAGLLLIGTQRFLYKVAAASDASTPLTTFAFMASVAVMSGLLVLLTGAEVQAPVFLVLISLANSLTFSAATMAHIQSLKHVPASLAYPLIRLNIVLVVLFSVLFLEERLDAWQWLGVAAAAAAMALLSRHWVDGSGGQGGNRRGMLLVGLAMLSGALSSITCKFAAVSVNTLAFIGLSYCFSTLFVLATSPRMFAGGTSRRGRAVSIGLVMGVFNLAGFYAFLQALSSGPLSLVASINGMHFMVAVFLARLIYKERITARAGLGLALTIVSLLLLRGS